MACDDRQLTEAQRVAGYQNQRTGVQQAVRPFSGRPTIENLIDYINRELQPAVRRTRDKVNEVYLPVVDNAPSGNPLGFYFSTETGNADPTTGRIRLDQAVQDTATTIRVSETNRQLADVLPWLDVMSGGVTSPLGVVTLTDAIDPRRFIRFDLNTMTDAGAYWNLGVTPIESSHDNPFVDGGPLTIAFIPGVGGATAATIPPTAISGADGPRQFLATSTSTTVDWRTLSLIYPGAPIYDVMAYPFNATGDGVADDLTAINAAIAAAATTPGMVYLGRAHRITGALTAIATNCIIIQGRGMDTNGTTLTCTTSPAAIVTFSSGARFSGIRDVRIVGASGTTGYAVIFQQAFRCFAHNLRISAVGNGIEIDRCNTTFIENIDIIDPLDDYGFHVHGVDPDFCHVTRFVRCQVGGSGTTYTGFAHGSFAHTVIYQHCGVLQGNIGMHVFDDQGSAPTFIHAWQFSSDHPVTTGILLDACDGAVMFDQTLATSVLTPGNPGITVSSGATRWQFNGGEANQGITIAGTAGILRGMHTSTIALSGTVDEVLVEHNHLTGALTIASGADNYVVTGNYVGGGITNTPGRAETRVVFDNVPDTEVAVGSVWGLQIDHGASDVPREVTKFELGENLRRETVVTDTTSSGTSATYTIASTTTQVQFKLAGALTINGMTAATLTFGKLVVFSFDSGFAGSVTWNNESGSAGAALERIRTPGGAALTISAGEIAVFEYFDSRWRCISVAKASVLTDGDKGDVTVSSSGSVWTVDVDINKNWTGSHTWVSTTWTVQATNDILIYTPSSGIHLGAGHSVANVGNGDIIANATGGVSLTAGLVTPDDNVGTGEIELQADQLVRIFTGGVERLEIENDGAWQVGGSSGTSGHPLLSAGASAPPAWGQVTATGIATDAVTTVKILDANVTLAKQADLAQSRIIGRAEGAGTGVPTALTPTQVISIVDGETVAWAGAHTFSNLFRLNAIQNLSTGAQQDDLSVAAANSLRCTASAAFDITGMVAGGDGQTILIANVGSANNVRLVDERDATLGTASAAANRFNLQTNTSLTLLPRELALFWYDGTSDRWRGGKLNSIA